MDVNSPQNIINEIKQYATFINPNNFDGYFTKVLPTKNINIIYASEIPLKKQVIEKPIKEKGPTKKAKKSSRLKAQSKNQTCPIFTILNKNQKRVRSSSDKDSTTAGIELLNTESLSSPLPQEEIKEGAQCFMCKWKYPETMTDSEKNVHMNFCLDKKGHIHKKSYLKQLENAMIVEEMYQTSQLDECPNCYQSFKRKSQKYKRDHMKECMAISDEVVSNLNVNKKRKTEVLG